MRREIAERRRAENALHMAELELELRVNERTVELRTINEGLLHEIEQCKQLEQTLKESEEQLRLAQEASGLGLWDLDPRADRAVWSAQHFRIFGFEPSARRFDLMSFVSLIHPDDRAAVEAAVRDALRPDGQFDAEYRIQRQDGQLRWVLSKGADLLRRIRRALPHDRRDAGRHGAPAYGGRTGAKRGTVSFAGGKHSGLRHLHVGPGRGS